VRVSAPFNGFPSHTSFLRHLSTQKDDTRHTTPSLVIAHWPKLHLVSPSGFGRISYNTRSHLMSIILKEEKETHMIEDTSRYCECYTCVRGVLSPVRHCNGLKRRCTTTEPTWLSIGAADKRRSAMGAI